MVVSQDSSRPLDPDCGPERLTRLEDRSVPVEWSILRDAVKRNPHEFLPNWAASIATNVRCGLPENIRASELSLITALLEAPWFTSEINTSKLIEQIKRIQNVQLPSAEIRLLVDLVQRTNQNRSIDSFSEAINFLDLISRQAGKEIRRDLLATVSARYNDPSGPRLAIDDEYLHRLREVVTLDAKLIKQFPALTDNLIQALMQRSTIGSAEFAQVAMTTGFSQYSVEGAEIPQLVQGLVRASFGCHDPLECCYVGAALAKLDLAMRAVSTDEGAARLGAIYYERIVAAAKSNSTHGVAKAFMAIARLVQEYSAPFAVVDELLTSGETYSAPYRVIPAARDLLKAELDLSYLVPSLLRIRSAERRRIVPSFQHELGESASDLETKRLYFTARLELPELSEAFQIFDRMMASWRDNKNLEGQSASSLLSDFWKSRICPQLEDGLKRGFKPKQVLATAATFLDLKYRNRAAREGAFVQVLQLASQFVSEPNWPRIEGFMRQAVQHGVHPGIVQLLMHSSRWASLTEQDAQDLFKVVATRIQLSRGFGEDVIVSLVESDEGRTALHEAASVSGRLADVVEILKRTRANSGRSELETLVDQGLEAGDASEFLGRTYQTDTLPWSFDWKQGEYRSPSHNAETNRAYEEIFEVVRRTADLARGFASDTFANRRIPGSKLWMAYNFAKDLATSVHFLNASTAELAPGKGLVTVGLRPERFFPTDGDSADRFVLARSAMPWLSPAIDDAPHSKRISLRGMTIWIGPDDKNYTINGVHYSFVVFNDHAFNQCADVAALVPTKVIAALFEPYLLAPGNLDFDPTRPDLCELGITPSKIYKYAEERGLICLNLGWPSILGGLGNAFPPGSEPFFGWEEKVSGSRDWAGHKHKHYLLRSEVTQVPQGGARAMIELQRAHALVYGLTTRYLALNDLSRLAFGAWSKGQTLDAEADDEAELEVGDQNDAAVTENPAASRMLRFMYAWNSKRFRDANENPDEYPVLIAAPCLSSARIPPSPFIFDSYSLTIKRGDEIIELPPFSDGTGKEELKIWREVVLPVVAGRTDMGLRAMHRRDLLQLLATE